MSPGGGRGEEHVGETSAARVENAATEIVPRRSTVAPAIEAPPPMASEPAAAITPMPALEPAPTGDLWARVLRGPGVTAVLRTILSNLRVKSVDAASGRVVIVGDAKYAESARSRQGMIVDALRRELGRGVELLIEADTSDTDDGVPEAAASEEVPTDRPDGRSAPVQPPVAPGPPQTLSEHPLIREAMELFGARIVDVQHRRPAAQS